MLAFATLLSTVDVCNLDSNLQAAISIVGVNGEASLLSSAEQRADDEMVACAAQRLGWNHAAAALVTARMQRKLASHNVRKLAQARRDAAAHFLARLHPRYPRHLKAVPALVWAQTEEVVQLRLRFARYTTGASLCQYVEHATVRVSNGTVHFTAEGADAPTYFDTTLQMCGPQHLSTAHRLAILPFAA